MDVLIVGGGLTGSTLMLALTNAGISCLLVEQSTQVLTQPDFDARSLALSPASVTILKMLKVWSLLQDAATPIKMIHVSEQQRFGSARLTSKDDNPLGYVIEIYHINRALSQRLDNRCILTGTISDLNPMDGTAIVSTVTGDINIRAQLIVAADGTRSSVRALCDLKTHDKNYEQHAVVANIGLTRFHQHQAYERFTQAGPLALLPLTDKRASLVWAMSPLDAARHMDMPDHVFLTQLQTAFGYRLGRFHRVGQRMIYPLHQVLMPKQVHHKVVFVGNAAHTLHPVAGQGFNLGLRDVAMLAQCVVHDRFGPNMLDTYLTSRRHDQTTITHFTNGLVELFTSNLPGMSLARAAGLIALDNSFLLKNILAKYARGYGGIIPDLACGISLPSQGLQ